MSLSGIANKTLWLDTSDYSRMRTSSTPNSFPTAPDDQIYQFLDASPSALTLSAINEGNARPFLRDNGSGQGELDCLNSTALRYLTAASSEATFNHILEGSGGIAFRLKCNTGLIGSGEIYFDSRALINTNKGWSVHRASANEVVIFTISNGTSAILTLTSNAAIQDTDEHTFIITIATGASACTMKQDGATVATGTITPTTGPAAYPLRMGANANVAASPANSRLRNVLIKSVPLTAGDETAWLAYQPLLGDLSESDAVHFGRIGMGLGVGL